MKKCPSCGNLNDYNSKFCKICGKKLPPKNICPYCKKEISTSDTYCKYCGKSLKNGSGSSNRKISKKLKITLIAIGSIIGFMVLAYFGLFLFSKYYPGGAADDYGTPLAEEEDTGSIGTMEPSFGELIISSSIDDETYEPINPTDEFDIGFREIYAAIEVSGVSPEDSFTYKWKYADSKEIFYDFSFNYFKNEGYIADYIIISGDEDIEDYPLFSESGNYVVEFYHNHELKSEACFTVNEADINDASFGEIITSKSSSAEDNSPIGPTDKFILGTKRICASIKVDGAKETDRWKFIFLEESSDDPIKEFEDYYYLDESEGSFNGYKTICLYITEDSGIEGIKIFGYPGKYIVGYSHNDTIISSREFEIIDPGIDFGDLVTCRDVNLEDDSPIDITDDFFYGTTQILVSIDIQGANLDDECSFVWINKDNGETIRDLTYKYADNFQGEGSQYNGYFTMGIALEEDMEPEEHDLLGVAGNYQIDFYHNGYLIDQKSFRIIKD